MARAKGEWLGGLLLAIVGLALVVASLNLVGGILVVIGILAMGIGEADGAGIRDAIVTKFRGD